MKIKFSHFVNIIMLVGALFGFLFLPHAVRAVDAEKTCWCKSATPVGGVYCDAVTADPTRHKYSGYDTCIQYCSSESRIAIHEDNSGTFYTNTPECRNLGSCWCKNSDGVCENHTARDSDNGLIFSGVDDCKNYCDVRSTQASAAGPAVPWQFIEFQFTYKDLSSDARCQPVLSAEAKAVVDKAAADQAAAAKAAAEQAVVAQAAAVQAGAKSTISRFIPDCVLADKLVTDPATGAVLGPCGDVSIYVILLLNISSYLFTIVGALALGAFIYGGIMIIISEGNPEKLKTGTDALMAAIIGLVIVFGAYLLIRFLGQALNIKAQFKLY